MSIGYSAGERLAELNRKTAVARAEAEAAAQEAAQIKADTLAVQSEAVQEARAKAKEARGRDARERDEQALIAARGVQGEVEAAVEAAFGPVDDAVNKAMDDAAEDAGDDPYTQLAARFQAALNLARGAGFDGPIAQARAEFGRAVTYLDLVKAKAAKAEADAVRLAGDSSAAKAIARANAIKKFAGEVEQAENQKEAASMAFDRLVVETAQYAAITAHRIKAAEKRLAEREKAEADPVRRANPYADPLPWVITQSQFNAIKDLAMKAKAGREAKIIPDDDPPFTRGCAEAALRSQGSLLRQVLTRAEFRQLSPVDQMKAAKTAIIVD